MINLMFCGNDRMFDGLLISLISIAKHTKEDLNVYLMTMNLEEENESYKPITEDQRKIIEESIQKRNKNNKVQLIDVTQTYKKELPTNRNKHTHYTPYIFIRLLSDKIPELPNKILYLDTDIVCYRDIKEIYNTDMEEYEIAASLDYIGRKMINRNYMNSGVVLMNLEKIRENRSFETAREICIKKRMALPDQTALNKACKQKVWLPDKCNEQKERKDDTIIRHFSMTIKLLPVPHLKNIKPWQIERVHKEYKIYDYEDIYNEYLDIKKQDERNKI